MGKTKVLIVDASPAVIDGLRSILNSHPDMKVVGEARDMAEAISKTDELRPDVILVDAQLPGQGSRSATHGLREQLPDGKILVMAVHSAHINEAMAAGADDYVMKDSGRQKLLQTIRQLGRQDQGGRSGQNPS